MERPGVFSDESRKAAGFWIGTFRPGVLRFPEGGRNKGDVGTGQKLPGEMEIIFKAAWIDGLPLKHRREKCVQDYEGDKLFSRSRSGKTRAP